MDDFFFFFFFLKVINVDRGNRAVKCNDTVTVFSYDYFSVSIFNDLVILSAGIDLPVRHF